MSSFKNIIIIGASGRLGPFILSAFLDDSRFSVSVLTRNSSKHAFPSNVKVHRVAGTYPESEVVTAFQGQDVVISLISPGANSIQATLIDAAIKAGVKRFIPSEFGGDVWNDKAMALLPQRFGPKQETVKYLRSKEASGLTWTAIVTGTFFDFAMKIGYMGFDMKEWKARIVDDGSKKWSTTTLNTVGLAVKNVMLLPAEETANKYLYVDSFTVNQNEVLAAFEQVTGEKWEVERVDGEEEKKTGLELSAKGDMKGMMMLIRYWNAVGGHGGDYMLYKEGHNDLLALPRQSLDAEIAKLLKEV